MKKIIVLCLLVLFTLPIFAQDAPETVVQHIDIVGLTGVNNDEDAEISGLGWYEDWLVLMVQNPIIYGGADDGGALFALNRDDVITYLNSDNPDPLDPVRIPILNNDLIGLVPGYNGFEAIVFQDDRVFMTIEAFSIDYEMTAYLISGTVDTTEDAFSLTLDTENIVELPPPPEDYFNSGQEAMTIVDDKILTFYERNGTVSVAEPFVYVVDMNDFSSVETIPMAHLEYRITDATHPDEDGLFWVSNFFFPGGNERSMGNVDDPIFEQYGISPSNARYGAFERLVALQYTEDGIIIPEIAPIQLDVPMQTGRNWEGIVRLDDLGFIVATDQFPETIVGFVPVESD